MNIVFFGTPDFSKKFLESLHADEDIFVSAVVTQPDKPVGRKKILTPSPVKVFAEDKSISVFEPEKLRNPEFINHIQDLKPDLFIIVAYGKIIPQKLLDIPKYGNINVHPSLLPKYRGPSPVQAAIAAGDKETGVSIMLIDEKMDHGPILMQKTIEISDQDDTMSILNSSAEIGAPMLVESMKRFVAGDLIPKEQNHDEATFCKLIKKEDGNVNWNNSAELIDAQLRAYRPWPGIYTKWNSKMLKLHSIEIARDSNLTLSPGEVKVSDGQIYIGTSTYPVEITELQIEGKQKMPAKAFIAGYSKIEGSVLK